MYVNGKMIPVETGSGICVHMYVNGKMIAVETGPGMRGGEDKEEWWRG
jgi:hypothetical protein